MSLMTLLLITFFMLYQDVNPRIQHRQCNTIMVGPEIQPFQNKKYLVSYQPPNYTNCSTTTILDINNPPNHTTYVYILFFIINIYYTIKQYSFNHNQHQITSSNTQYRNTCDYYILWCGN